MGHAYSFDKEEMAGLHHAILEKIMQGKKYFPKRVKSATFTKNSETKKRNVVYK